MKFAPVLFPIIVLAMLAGCSRSPASNDGSPSDQAAAGKPLYLTNCAACHMADGSGVPDMQPALNGSAVVAGDPNTLIRVVLEGPAKVLPADRPTYSNTMPPFARLSDQDIANILTYVRQQFGGNATSIQPAQVAALRTQ